MMAALERFAREHGVVRFPHYTVCFVMVYDRTLPERRIRDYDNLELKAVLDAAACFLMESDSGLLCEAGPAFCSGAWHQLLYVLCFYRE